MVEARKENRLNFQRLAQRIRVPLGFALAPILLIAASPTIVSLIVGIIVAVIGLAIRAWASGHLKKNEELTTRGPYAHTRNPLYLGTLLLGGGVAIGTGALWIVALFVTLYLLIYVPVMFAEAETVRRLFPEEYENYSHHVPLFVPRTKAFIPETGNEIGSRKSFLSEQKRFDSSLYLRHREYRAALGLIAIYLFLTAKFFWRL